MNSLEALISLTALLAFFGAMLTLMNQQKENVALVSDSVEAKGNALSCAAIIDFIYSNSIDSYSEKIECSAEETRTWSVVKGSRKEAGLIAKTENEFGLKVNSFGHYVK